MVDACRIAGASPASGLLRADRVDDVGVRLRANSCFLDLSASASAEDCHFSPQRRSVRREAQAHAPSSRRSLRLCGESLVFPAEAEAGFRHSHPQDRSVKTAAVAAGIAADGRTSKTGCRSREIVQAGASPASGLLRADRVDDVGARLRANSCFRDLSASASAEDCHFSPQRCGVRAERPNRMHLCVLCVSAVNRFVFLAEAEAGFRHPYPQDRSVKTAAAAAGIAADGRTSKTGCRGREIVQAGASPASGLLRADRVDDVGARLRANSCFHDLSASASAEDCHFSLQRRSVRREPKRMHPLLCGESIVLLADVETRCRSREIVQAGASPASYKPPGSANVGARLRANSFFTITEPRHQQKTVTFHRRDAKCAEWPKRMHPLLCISAANRLFYLLMSRRDEG
jgi:hypothetical protein